MSASSALALLTFWMAMFNWALVASNCSMCCWAFTVSYTPVLWMAGSTSLVTQCLKAFALGILLLKIRLYRPDSLMRAVLDEGDTFPFWESAPCGSISSRLSSSSTWAMMALPGFLYPSATATSLPTSQGVPSISTVRTCPNSGFSKICKSFMWICTSLYSLHFRCKIKRRKGGEWKNDF